MKKQWSWVGVAVASILSVAGSAQASQRVEIPVEVLLAPPTGFDDNDNIQIIAHGKLPNSVCYSLADYEVKKSETAGGEYQIRQYATQKTDGICANEAEVPTHLRVPVPFDVEISLGQLPAGEYRFTYKTMSGQNGVRKLGVTSSTEPTVDYLPYAAVSNALTTDVIKKDENMVVTLSGVLNSSCTQLDEIRVNKVNDVYVVQPTIRVETGVFCLQTLIPFMKTVDLGPSQPGHYLIHIRTMNGGSVNRVVKVTK